MTVNERLFVAGLLDAYDAAVESGDLRAINAVLAQVELRQDDKGMNWTVEDPDERRGFIDRGEEGERDDVA